MTVNFPGVGWWCVSVCVSLRRGACVFVYACLSWIYHVLLLLHRIISIVVDCWTLATFHRYVLTAYEDIISIRCMYCTVNRLNIITTRGAIYYLYRQCYKSTPLGETCNVCVSSL